jgi:hypothetical protein
MGEKKKTRTIRKAMKMKMKKTTILSQQSVLVQTDLSWT